MRQTTTLIATAVATLLAASAAHGQTLNEGPAEAAVVPNDTVCTYNFGAGALVWCVNVNGNLMRFQSPAGEEHIRVGGFAEGYGVCVDGDPVDYHDFAMSSAGFGAPVLVALTATSVTINRTTSDGKFLLTQKWSRDTTERDVTVQMTLQNLGPLATVKVLRFADVDANNDFGDDRWDKSRYGVWIKDVDAVTLTGLTLSPQPTSAVTGAVLPASCAPVSLAVPGGPGDAAALVIYNLGSLTTGAKKIMKVGFRAQ